MSKVLFIIILFLCQTTTLLSESSLSHNQESEFITNVIYNPKISIQKYIHDFDEFLFKNNVNHSLTLDIFNAAILKAKETNDKRKIAWSQYYYAEALSILQKSKEALTMYSQSKILFEEINDNCGFNRCLLGEGEVLNNSSNILKAIPLIQQAYHGAESCQDTIILIRALYNLGFISGIQKDLNRTINYYNEGINLAKLFGWYSKEIDIKRSLGNAYKEQGNVQKSLTILNQADSLLKVKQPSNNYLKAVILTEIGLIESNYLKKVDLGLSKFLIAREIFDSLKRHNWSSYMRAIIADANCSKGNYKNAMNIALEGYHLTFKYNLLKERIDNLEIMYKIAVKQRNFKLALDYYIEMTKTSNSLINVESIDKMISLELKFAHEKKILDDSLKFIKKVALDKLEKEKIAFQNRTYIKTIITWFAAILIIFLLLLITYIIYTNNKKQKRQLEFTHKLIRTQEDERTRISRELHDGIGQQLVLLKNIAHQKSHFDLVKMIEDTLIEMRNITHLLHPFILKQFGISEALKKLLKNTDENSEIFFTIEIDNITGIYNEDTELNIFRIIQELINNMIKHSGSASAEFTLKKKNTEVIITLKDYGIGFSLKEVKQNQTLGMKTIKERCDMIGAQLIIQSIPKFGTSITLLLTIPT